MIEPSPPQWAIGLAEAGYESFFAISGHTDLRKGVSKAKFDGLPDFDVKKILAPPNSAENYEKPTNKSEKSFRKHFLASKHRKLQIIRNARCRSFVQIRAKFVVAVAVAVAVRPSVRPSPN